MLFASIRLVLPRRREGDGMNIEEFAKLVKKMRDAQKMYFKTRDSKVLSESKRLEKEVDKAVDLLLNICRPLF